MISCRAWGCLAVIAVMLGLTALPTAFSAPPQPDGLIASPEPDWPQFRGPRRDAVSAETGLLPTWPEGGPRLLWKKENLGRGWSSPIVVGPRLYITGDVGEDLVVYALDLDGNLKWQAANGRSWKGSYPGARATCAYSEGRLYHMNAHGRVACLDASTGVELWAVDALERFQGRNITWAVSECLLVDGPRVVVTPGGQKALMAALDKTNGRTVWTTQPIPGERVSHASPILFRCAGRRVLANCSSDHGFGVDADTGKLLWAVPLSNQYGVNASMPIYGEGCLLYATAYTDGTCYRLQPRGERITADTAWTTPLDNVTGSGVLVGGRLYESGYRRFKSWLCLDWRSGEILYKLKDLTTGAAVYADGRLYCLAEDGRAAMLRPTAAAFDVVGQFRLAPEGSRDAWAHPVLLHGRLYLRYHDRLWCYDVRAR